MRNVLRDFVQRILPRPPESAVPDILSKVPPADLIRAFFALLLREGPDAKEVWSTFHQVFRDKYEPLSTALGSNLQEHDIIDLLALFIIEVARNGVFVPERTVKIFHCAENMGVHMLPVHFYSPVPNT